MTMFEKMSGLFFKGSDYKRQEITDPWKPTEFHIMILSEQDMLKDLCSSVMSLLPLFILVIPSSLLLFPSIYFAPDQ